MNNIRIYWTDLTQTSQENIRQVIKERIENDDKDLLQSKIDEQVQKRFDELGLVTDPIKDKGWIDGTREIVIDEMISDIINRSFNCVLEI